MITKMAFRQFMLQSPGYSFHLLRRALFVMEILTVLITMLRNVVMLSKVWH